MTITIALTKGRIKKSTVDLLTQAGFDMSFMKNKGRHLIFESPDQAFRFLLVKAPDVATYVRHGVADLGIVGKDLLIEYATGVLEVLNLNFRLCKFAVASVPSYNPQDHKRKRIATKYLQVARQHFHKIGSLADFTDVFEKTNVTGVLAASVFHYGEIEIPRLKEALAQAGVEVGR